MHMYMYIVYVYTCIHVHVVHCIVLRHSHAHGLTVGLQLRPPEVYLNGTEVKCEPPDCSLHLHIDTTSYSRLGVYSTDSAPGIIVAHGTYWYMYMYIHV